MSNKVTNEDLLVEIAKSKEEGEITYTLGKMMVYIANRIANRNWHQSLTYQDDMISHAITQMVVSYSTFDPTKSDNPFAFLVQVTNCAFINFIAKEKLQKRLKQENNNEENLV